MAGFLGAEPGKYAIISLHKFCTDETDTAVPVWEIRNAYEPEDVHNMLVSNTRLGASLAASFSSKDSDLADKTVVLM